MTEHICSVCCKRGPVPLSFTHNPHYYHRELTLHALHISCNSIMYYFIFIFFPTRTKHMQVCTHCSDFPNSVNFISKKILQNVPLYVDFSIPPSGKKIISPCSTPPMCMRFFTHLHSSPMYKKTKSHQLYHS
jgi:hypothetical protein